MKKYLYAVIFVVVIALVVIGIIFLKNESGMRNHPLPLVAGEEVKDWTFPSFYTGRTDLEEKANSEIKRLTDLLGGKSKSTDYELYVSIASQYNMIGDGDKEYKYLGKAILADASASSGLAWYNLGLLLEKVGAIKTARISFEKANEIQPQLYEHDLESFLDRNFPNDFIMKVEDISKTK